MNRSRLMVAFTRTACIVLQLATCLAIRAQDRTQLISSYVLSANTHDIGTLKLAFPNAVRKEANVHWSLHLNSQFSDVEVPDPVFGIDHAAGKASSTISIDGKDFGDAKVTDNDAFSSFESPWTQGYQQAQVEIDLKEVRNIKAMRWLAADANWIWKVDVSFSTNGNEFISLPLLQAFDMHKKWNLHEFPIEKPFDARFIRFRFYNPDGVMNVMRLPKTIEVYDGVENDRIEPPKTVEVLQKGNISVTLDAEGQGSTTLASTNKLAPGAYLLTWNATVDGKRVTNWEHLFVRPTDSVDKNTTRRFGINASDIKLANLMSECGFGWVRFENGKWSMSSTGPDHYAYDGSVAPWHVNQDMIYNTYQDLDMKVLPYVFQTPEWANSAGPDIKVNRMGYPPKNPADYGDAIFQMVARFGKQKHAAGLLKTPDKKSGMNQIDAIELWNEPNLVGPTWAAFVGPMELYFEVMRAGVEGARRADPNLTVTSCGFAGVELATLKQMTDFKYADGKCPLDLVDVINVHFYSGVQEPETALEDPNIRKEKTSAPEMTYLDQLDDLIEWRDAHKPEAEIWMTETGNDVGGPIGLSERKQAAKLPRVTMITLARGIDKVFIYRESGSKPSMHAGAGLIRDDGTIRPSWFTMATLMRELQGFDGKAERVKHSDPNVWILRWKNDQRQCIAAWCIGEANSISMHELPGDFKPKTLVDAFGFAKNIDEFSSTIELGEFPIYLK